MHYALRDTTPTHWTNHSDITNPIAIANTLDKIPNMDWVINCAAYTAVDDCETNEAHAININGNGAGNIAKYCAMRDTPLIHFSTDYIFDGEKDSMYQETDAPQPINAYGRSKLAGEQAIQNSWQHHLIFRVQWLYGAHGPNFVETMRTLAQSKTELSIVSDQYGTPTWTCTIADFIISLLDSPPKWGLYHYRPSGQTNWAEFAEAIFQLTETPMAITPIPSDAYPRPAKRPKNGVLNTYKFLNEGIQQPPHWYYCLSRYLATPHS